jgi:hypothetical protein
MARSSRGVHPTISDFNEIWYTASMDKYNNPYFFIFSVLALVQFLQPFENYSECWHSSNRGKTTEQHCLLQLSIPRQLKGPKDFKFTLFIENFMRI